MVPDTPLQSGLRRAGDIAERYGISALSGLLHSATAAAAQKEINVAVLTELSIRDRGSFIEPLPKVQKQAFRALQQVRDRVSERTMRAFGVPLRTSETEISVQYPAAPNIRVGRVFDRNWEILSPVLPVWVIRSTVHRHFRQTISRAVYQNISRLTTQW